MALDRTNHDTAFLVGRLIAITEHYAGRHFGPNTLSNMYQHPAHGFDVFRRYIDQSDEYLQEIMATGLQIPITAKNEVEKGTMALGYYAQKAEYEATDKTSERQRVGRRIAELRKEQNMTQAQLADRCGIAQAHIARIETGRYSVGLDTLAQIATALGRSIDFVEP